MCTSPFSWELGSGWGYGKTLGYPARKETATQEMTRRTRQETRSRQAALWKIHSQAGSETDEGKINGALKTLLSKPLSSQGQRALQRHGEASAWLLSLPRPDTQGSKPSSSLSKLIRNSNNLMVQVYAPSTEKAEAGGSARISQ